MTNYHLGDWEKEIGYSQSVKVGNHIWVSGTTADTNANKDMPSQLKDIYNSIGITLAHDGATLKNIVRETIYCTKMYALTKCQELRKEIYNGHLPAATWVEVARLYSPDHLIEIEVEAVLE